VGSKRRISNKNQLFVFFQPITQKIQTSLKDHQTKMQEVLKINKTLFTNLMEPFHLKSKQTYPLVIKT